MPEVLTIVEGSQTLVVCAGIMLVPIDALLAKDVHVTFDTEDGTGIYTLQSPSCRLQL